MLDVVPCPAFRYVCMELDLEGEKIRFSLFFCMEFLSGLFIFNEMNQVFLFF